MSFFEMMTPEGWVTLTTVVALFVALVMNWAPPDMLFLGAVAFLATLGIISSNEAFAGFSNESMLTVGLLFVVAAGLRETGVLDLIGQHILGKAKSERAALVRLGLVVIPLSAFLNNTPIVAMFVPIVLEWSRRNNVSPSKLLIPLSFLTILGGTCSLIGTSTNLVVNGLMVDAGIRGMSLFEISLVGIPYAIIGMAYLLIIGPKLLPERKELLEQLGESRREFLAEMQVQPGCRMIGKSVEAAGLRQLPGMFLIEIDRDGRQIAPVGPEETLQANDRLIFTGVVSSIIELEKIPGLVPIADPDYEVSPQKQRRQRLCEAVISENSPLVGRTIRDADFRATYGAAVVAVHRGGQRVERKVGDIALKPGDTLLLQTGAHFVRAHRNNPAFYLVSDVEGWSALRRDRAWIAIVLFLALIALMSTGVVSTAIAATIIAVLMVAFGCLSAGEAHRSVEWQVLITIAAAFAVGTALQNSGVATAVATSFVNATRPFGWIAALAVIYLLGSAITEMITNNAAAILMFPFCLETARLFNVSDRPFLMALVLSASASFMTPIGYQTNMMVYGPGGYKFSDFLRIGSPLNLLLWPVAVFLIPIFWPFVVQ